MLNAKELAILNDAIETKKAALQRAANTEKDEQIKELRIMHLQQINQLQAKINTKGLFDEPQISKQK